MLVIAHRGAAGYAPENTIAAIKLALQQNVKAIEIDVQLTKDEYVIVCHDSFINRTTNGEGAIKDMTLKEIKQYDAGSWYHEDFAGERIPTLNEVLEVIPDTVLLNIEVKKFAYDTRDIEQKLVNILEKENRINSVIISSFNHECLKRIKSINAQIRISPLLSAYLAGTWNYLEANEMNIYSFHPNNYNVTADLVKELHEHSIKVYCWTINNYELAMQLQEIGVDGIITDFPDILNR